MLRLTCPRQECAEQGINLQITSARQEWDKDAAVWHLILEGECGNCGSWTAVSATTVRKSVIHIARIDTGTGVARLKAVS